MNCIALPLAGLLIAILLNVLFFTKKHYNNIETKIYSYLIILNLIEAIFAVVFIIIAKTYGTLPFSIIGQKIDHFLLLEYGFVITLYVINITFKSKKTIKSIFYTTLIINIISVFLIMISSMKMINFGDVLNTEGTATDILVLTEGIFLLLMVVSSIIGITNKKTIKTKYVPIVLLVLLCILVFTLRQIIPNVLFETFLFSFINLIMYHTIENPDLKLIEKLTEAKENAEHSNNNKSAFIFNIVNKIRGPINNYIRIGNEILKENDINELKNGVKVLIEEAEASKYLVNNILDISSIDVKNLKILKTKYNFNNLMTGITNSYSIKIKNKKVEFRVNIEEDIPTNLYGDSIRLKQIINTLLDNAYKYTDKGFIELRISAVTRFDICRLIIVVEDSGKGMDITKSNKVFYDYGQNIDLEKLNEDNMNLPIVQKLVDLIGGSIMLKSIENKGTEIILTIDQKIVEEKNEESYNIKQTKTLIISDDETIYNELLKIYKNDNINFVFAKGGQKGLELIRKEELFDIIIINSELEKLSSIDTLNKLTKEEGVKCPIIVLTKKGEGSKYKPFGFTDIIEKPITKEATEKIFKKYI